MGYKPLQKRQTSVALEPKLCAELEGLWAVVFGTPKMSKMLDCCIMAFLQDRLRPLSAEAGVSDFRGQAERLKQLDQELSAFLNDEPTTIFDVRNPKQSREADSRLQSVIRRLSEFMLSEVAPLLEAQQPKQPEYKQPEYDARADSQYQAK